MDEQIVLSQFGHVSWDVSDRFTNWERQFAIDKVTENISMFLPKNDSEEV